jgi:hypothetical protein
LVSNGTIVFAYVPLSLRDAQLNCKADGYQPFREHRLLTGADPEPALVAVLDARSPSAVVIARALRLRMDIWRAAERRAYSLWDFERGVPK